MIHPDLHRQLERELREAQAAERVELERTEHHWHIEGWDHDELRIYIAGFGLLILPVDEVQRLGSALLAEHHIHTWKEKQ